MTLKRLNGFVEAEEDSSVLETVLVDPAVSAAELVSFYWNHQQWYLPGQPCIRLRVLLYRNLSRHSGEGSAEAPRLIITDQTTAVDGWLDAEYPALVSSDDSAPTGSSINVEEVFNGLAAHCGTPVIALDAPVPLIPVSIPKPWGREIWYTGIEARGQSLVGSEEYSIPLSWLLDLGGEALLGKHYRSLNLLKVLDPLPEPVYGDLYLELHEKKREVYVVTHVDDTAWPGGKGAIRYGFDAQIREQYESDQDFRDAVRESIAAYESVRREIDDRYDVYRRTQGLALDEPVPAETLQCWQETLPDELQNREREARAAMNRFTHLLPLGVGDVVQVPCLLPHSLQHGVRTVEFQSPVYERKILSFAQKVLTQAHWDTEEAVALMTTQVPEPSKLELLAKGSGWRRELIVEFDDFSVERISLVAGAEWPLVSGSRYALVMALNPVVLGGSDLPAESAALVPVTAEQVLIKNAGTELAIILVARPGES